MVRTLADLNPMPLSSAKVRADIEAPLASIDATKRVYAMDDVPLVDWRGTNGL